MIPTFKVPQRLEDLATCPQDDEGVLYARDVIDIYSLDAAEIHRLVAAVITELGEKDVTCVLEQPIFDHLYSLVRGQTYLEVSTKSILIDTVCTNLVQLNASISVLTKSVEESNDDVEDALYHCHAHCNALKIYLYFLLSIIATEEAKPEAAGEPGGGNRIGSKVRRPRKTHVPQDWDWSILRRRSLRALASALQNDLQIIFESRRLDEGLISLLAKIAFKMFESRDLLEKGACKQELCTIVSACTVQYGHGVSSVVTIIDLLHKFEHLPAHMADLVFIAENQYRRTGGVAVDILRAIGQLDPKNFERDNAGAENVGLFLEELASRLPRIMATNLSVILGHLEGKSYKMRNSVVKVIGTLLVEAIKDPTGMSSNDDTRIRNEQALLNILLERTRDVSAHTRKHVLQTWAHLCKEHAVPIGHWNLVSDLAAGRLDDTAAIVRKNALQLLETLLEYNPFGPSLRLAAFEATFEKYTGKLAVMSPRAQPSSEEPGSNLQHIERTIENADVHNTTEFFNGGRTVIRGEEPQLQTADFPPEDRRPHPKPPSSTEIGGIEHTRALVASLESALRFSKCIGSTMNTLATLLASAAVGDVESTIQLLIVCKKFEVDGAAPCLRKALPLVFSGEERIKAIVAEAFKTLYLRGGPVEVASNLITLMLETSLGDLASVEALVTNSMSEKEISSGVVSALWDFFTFNAQGYAADKSRAALAILSMAAQSSPNILTSHLQNIMDIGFGRWAKEDVLMARNACLALQRLPESVRANFKSNHKIFSILSNMIVRPGLPEACWYSAVEQAINAIYVLHPAPETLACGILMKLVQAIFSTSSSTSDNNMHAGEQAVDGEQPTDYCALSTAGVSHLLFAIAHVALKHLVYIESCIKAIRKRSADAEKSATNGLPESGRPPSTQDEGIAVELGLAASEEAKLEGLAEQAETELISSNATHIFLIGVIAPIVTRICLNSNLMQQSQSLRSSAILALCKLMIIDASFCEKNLQLLFTVAQNSMDDHVRSNCIIAIGDLALRFPNLLEPWMESIYARVQDGSKSVRKNAVLVLSHLILNDLIKVKGYISEMAMHLADEDPRISDLVKLFFHELSKKGSNPINNLLPDILSRLSSHQGYPQEAFKSVMQFLIITIKKTKQIEALIDKLCNRFVGNSDARQWQDIAYCLSLLSYSQSCIRHLADNFKLYQHALGNVGVFDHFKSLIAKTRNSMKLATTDTKHQVDDLEEKLTTWHDEKREQEAAWQKAQDHQRRTNDLKAQLYDKCKDGKVAASDEVLDGGSEDIRRSEAVEVACIVTRDCHEGRLPNEVIEAAGHAESLPGVCDEQVESQTVELSATVKREAMEQNVLPHEFSKTEAAGRRKSPTAGGEKREKSQSMTVLTRVKQEPMEENIIFNDVSEMELAGQMENDGHANQEQFETETTGVPVPARHRRKNVLRNIERDAAGDGESRGAMNGAAVISKTIKIRTTVKREPTNKNVDTDDLPGLEADGNGKSHLDADAERMELEILLSKKVFETVEIVCAGDEEEESQITRVLHSRRCERMEENMRQCDVPTRLASDPSSKEECDGDTNGRHLEESTTTGSTQRTQMADGTQATQDTDGTQEYPYMDLDLESQSTKDLQKPHDDDDTSHETERMGNNREEKTRARGEVCGQSRRKTSSTSASTPTPQQLTKTVAPNLLERNQKVGDLRPHRPAAKVQYSSTALDRASGESVLKPRNERVWR